MHRWPKCRKYFSRIRGSMHTIYGSGSYLNFWAFFNSVPTVRVTSFHRGPDQGHQTNADPDPGLTLKQGFESTLM
jgi:hypothetical protein